MKKIFSVFFALLIVASSVCHAEPASFLTEEEIPTGAKFLPLPPEPTDDAFYNDKLRYEWGKSIRSTPRGQQAIEDANTSLEYFAKIYSEPFGLTISAENTPKTYELMNRLLATAHTCNHKSKSRIMRARPFIVFNEPTPVPRDEEILRTNSSYPSGHTTMGWTIALVLAEINPARQDEILKRGYEYGDSRVIVGFHFQSDVDAARVISSTLVVRLHDDNEFTDMLQQAKEEFADRINPMAGAVVGF